MAVKTIKDAIEDKALIKGIHDEIHRQFYKSLSYQTWGTVTITDVSADAGKIVISDAFNPGDRVLVGQYKDKGKVIARATWWNKGKRFLVQFDDSENVGWNITEGLRNDWVTDSALFKYKVHPNARLGLCKEKELLLDCIKEEPKKRTGGGFEFL